MLNVIKNSFVSVFLTPTRHKDAWKQTKRSKNLTTPKTKIDKNKNGCKICTRKPFHIDLSANQNENLSKFFYHILFLWPQVPIRSWIPCIFGPFSPFYPFFGIFLHFIKSYCTANSSFMYQIEHNTDSVSYLSYRTRVICEGLIRDPR